MTDWAASVGHLERARPISPPGAVPAYHMLSYGFILGELVRRVTGTPVRDFLARQVLDPLDLPDTHLGLPDQVWGRNVPIHADGRAGRIKEYLFNRRATRQAVIPAAGISTTARDLACFYQALLDAGDAGVFTAATVAQARQPSSDGELDKILRVQMRWSQAFQLGGPGTSAAWPRAMGGLSGPQTFGHNGSKCCIAWADPQRRLVFAYLTDRLPARHGSIHQAAVADAILAACH